ncbi:MAG: ACT domain-containing protein [Peptostreptococcaceae bacterium]|nr:ACT domain-containing protein [Peptostreptococcaceae bacterium]
MKAVITVIGKDTTGILAAVSKECANKDCNVIDVTQSVLDGYFCMIMIVEVLEDSTEIKEIETSISKAVPEMVVHVMHEDIFNLMHRI